MNTPHKHAALIKAWADGAEIECRQLADGDWIRVSEPAWSKTSEYRIKPEPKPDVVRPLRIELDHGWPHIYIVNTGTNLKLTFDGETGKLKAAEVIA